MANDLTGYLSRSVLSIFKSLVHSALFNREQRSFLLGAMKNAEKASAKRKKAEKQGTHIPPFLIASITPDCNLSCKGCYARANAEKAPHCGEDMLAVDDWRRIFAEAEEMGVSFILLAGGEPFLHRDVLALAGEFPKLIFPIFTNGTLFKRENIAMIRKHRNLVPMISIEGGQAETDLRRGKGIYEKIVKAMSVLSADGVIFGVSITVTKSNCDEVTDKEFLGKLIEAGTRAVVFVEYESMSADDRDLCFDDASRGAFLGRLAGIRTQFPGAVFLAFPGDEKGLGGCLAAGRGFFHINSFGGVEPCPFSPFSDYNLKNGSLKQAMDSNLFVSLRESGILTADHNGGCVLHGRESEVVSLLKNGK